MPKSRCPTEGTAVGDEWRLHDNSLCSMGFGLFCYDAHIGNLEDEHQDGRYDLHFDDGIFVFGFQIDAGNDVEVGSHWGQQGATVTGGQRQGNHVQRVCTQVHNERNTDTNGHNGDGSESVAHDDGEQHHTDGVCQDADIDVAFRDNLAEYACKDFAYTGAGEDSAQTGQQQRHDKDGACHTQEAATFLHEGHNLVFFIPNQQQGDTKDGSKQRANQRVPAFEEDCDAQSEHSGGQGWDKDFHTNLIEVGALLLLRRSLQGVALYAVEGGRDTNQADQDADLEIGQPHTKGYNDAQGEPEKSGGKRVFAVLFGPAADAGIHTEKSGKQVQHLYQFIRDGEFRA